MFGNVQRDQRKPIVEVSYLLKDSKTMLTVNFRTQKCTVAKVQTIFCFPHNFQSVSSPEGIVYLVGGGDYQKEEESLYQLH
mmetsp:Transcript_11436/g.19324  ORF Transcript_11436/g.19324 Transcript_11436/m.19324 type:complete len:81 (-) Transcript_11436:835-1077(-)